MSCKKPLAMFPFRFRVICKDFEIVTLNDLTGIAKKVADSFGKKLVVSEVQRFSDSETSVAVSDPLLVNGKNVFVVESIFMPIHENFLNFLLLVNNLKRNGAKNIVAVFPYFGYVRRDKDGGMELIAKLLEVAGVTRVIMFEAHSEKIAELFSIDYHNFSLSGVIAEKIKQSFSLLNQISIVAPDKGAEGRASEVAKILGCSIVLASKKRTENNGVHIECISGSCSKKAMIVVDDIVDSGQTAIQVYNALKKRGACDVYGYFGHSVFSGDGFDNIESSDFEKIFVSNTIPLMKKSNKIELFNVSEFIINSIKGIVDG
ncbi:ribose-phosphate pyrophosphokinase [bacterium]|jgi:ribose-phosphate pyrophosphokinase|nr:ribose-phosphate pyrophosphokinase [bacterium]